jgi:two-component system response regulator
MNKPNHILLVEDSENDELLTLRALKQHNITNPVVVARDGAEAVDYLLGMKEDGQPANELPVVVMLDLKLPKLGGIQVLQRIRENERTRLLPVVVLTSSDEECDIRDCYNLGVNSFVQKPVEFGSFMDAVGKLGMYWILVNEPPPLPR